MAAWEARNGGLRVRAPAPPTHMVLRTGAVSANTTRWLPDLRQHCADKYGAQDSVQTVLLQDLNAAAAARPEEVASGGAAERQWSDTLMAKSGLREKKSTGHGPISAEVLRGLLADARWGVHCALKAYYEGTCMSPASWRWIRLVLLPKILQPRSWDK